METLTTPTGLPGLRNRLPRRGDQADLARRLGWHPNRVSRYLHGQRVPTIAIARRIAEALECSVDDLLTSENNA